MLISHPSFNQVSIKCHSDRKVCGKETARKGARKELRIESRRPTPFHLLLNDVGIFESNGSLFESVELAARYRYRCDAKSAKKKEKNPKTIPKNGATQLEFSADNRRSDTAQLICI